MHVSPGIKCKKVWDLTAKQMTQYAREKALLFASLHVLQEMSYSQKSMLPLKAFRAPLSTSAARAADQRELRVAAAGAD